MLLKNNRLLTKGVWTRSSSQAPSEVTKGLINLNHGQKRFPCEQVTGVYLPELAWLQHEALIGRPHRHNKLHLHAQWKPVPHRIRLSSLLSAAGFSHRLTPINTLKVWVSATSQISSTNVISRRPPILQCGSCWQWASPAWGIIKGKVTHLHREPF